MLNVTGKRCAISWETELFRWIERPRFPCSALTSQCQYWTR